MNTDQKTAAGATPVDRVRYLIAHTRHTQASFARALGVDPGYISRILSGKLNVTESFINRIVVNLNVSKQWLRDGTDVPFPREHKDIRSGDTPGAPVYDIDISAGTTPLSRMFTDERIVGRVKLPGINEANPIVRVNGNSMMPVIPPGSYISIRPLEPSAPMAWGRICVVVLPDYRLVKYVRRNDKPDYVTLHSANPAYDDIEVPRSDIEGLYLVENVINHDLLA